MKPITLTPVQLDACFGIGPLDFLDLCKGHPLRLLATGERVYFRRARFSPHAGCVLATVADEQGGIIAVEAGEVALEEDPDDY